MSEENKNRFRKMLVSHDILYYIQYSLADRTGFIKMAIDRGHLMYIGNNIFFDPSKDGDSWV